MPASEIRARETVVRDARSRQEFPAFFVETLVIRAIDNVAVVSYRPYNYADKSIYPSADRNVSLTVRDFWGFVGDRPTLARAMDTLTDELAKVAREAENATTMNVLVAKLRDSPNDMSLLREVDEVKRRIVADLLQYS